MSIFSKKKPQKRVINTGTNLPKASMSDYFELRQERGKAVVKPILKQSRKDKTVLYGAFAVNKLLGQNYERGTYDLDVYSRTPKQHAIEIEKSIDQTVNADLAYVEQTEYPSGGDWKKLYRVKLKNDVTEADFNSMPKDIKYTEKKGVRYESLERAEKKYKRMLKKPELGRGFNANIDLGRIESYKRFKKR